jgi:hypothetical protein
MTRALLAVCLLLAAARSTMAQDAPSLAPHRISVSGGMALAGGYDIGSATALLRRNETGTTTPGLVTLFAADGAIERAASVEARVGFTLSPTIVIEFGGSYSRPVVAVDITTDSEAGDTPLLTDQRLSEYVVDVSGLWQIPKLNLGSRAAPYVMFGGGYLRQLDIDRVRAETGKIFHVGGGVRYWFRGERAQGRALGARAEIAAQARSGGVDFEEGTRIAPALKIFAFFSF